MAKRWYDLPMQRLPDFIRWETPEYHHTEKSADWHWIVWIVAGTCALAAILLGNLVFGIFIVIATFALKISTAEAPEIIECEADGEGVRVGNILYPYSELEGFGIDKEAFSFPRLVLRSQKTLMAIIIVPLENVDTRLLSDFLERHLPNENLKEPLEHKVLEYLGF